MRLGAALGGEQSGHVIFREYSTTGLADIATIELAHDSETPGLILMAPPASA